MAQTTYSNIYSANVGVILFIIDSNLELWAVASLVDQKGD